MYVDKKVEKTTRPFRYDLNEIPYTVEVDYTVEVTNRFKGLDLRLELDRVPEELNGNFATATAAKLLQSYPTLCDPIDGSPPGSAVPGILQARVLKWVAISFSNA